MAECLAKYIPRSELSQTIFPPAPKFDPATDIPDLTGKVIIVTGGNSGIGYHTVLQLATKNARVYLAARSRSKAEEALARLKKETGKSAIFLEVDLSDLNSIKRAAREFLSKETKLDVLFNNAGIMTPPTDQLSTQGYDIQFAVNTLAPYYFTQLLLPALERSTAENSTKARVVNTTSAAHTYAPGNGIEWKTLKGGPDRDALIKKWGTSTIPGRGSRWKLYGISKTGTIFVTHLLNRYHGDKCAAFSCHPGGIQTELQRHWGTVQRSVLNNVLKPTPWGARTQLWAGITPEAESAVDGYIVPWGRVGYCDPRADNLELEEELRVYLEKQVKPYEA